MPVIQYNIPIRLSPAYSNQPSKTIRDAEISEDRFISEVDNISSCYLRSKLGFSENSVQEIANSAIYINEDAELLKDGLSLDLSSGEVYVPELINGKLRFDLGLLSNNAMVGVYKRTNNEDSLYKKFKYGTGPFTYSGNITDIEESEDGDDTYHYVDFDLSSPIEYGRLNQYKSEIPFEAYKKASESYESYVQDSGITKELFLDKCEHITYTDSNINEINISNFSVSFSSKYYPITKDVALLVELVSGEIIQVSKNQLVVNQTNGIIQVQNFNIGRGQDILGFYLFYGILPFVKVARDTQIDLYKEVDPSVSLNLLEVDTYRPYSSPRLTNDYVTFGLKEHTEYAETSIYIPQEYSNWFIESDANISVNGLILEGGQRRYYTNEGINNISISVPSNILDVIEPISYDSSSERYSIKNYIPGNLVSIFGKFNNGKNGSIAHICFSRKLNIKTVIHSYGYGKGPYSFGAYSSGSLQREPDPKTNLLYKDNSPEEYFILEDDITFVIDPEVDGLSFHLPACSIKENIKVYEVLGDSVKNEFSSWEFGIPDSITLNSGSLRKGAKYMVVIKPLINPLLTTLYINSGTFKSSSLKEVRRYSGVLDGLYSINSKMINFNFGTRLDNGTIVYFKPKLRADMIISKEALISITSKFKDIVF